jgi:hypothetical protein
MGMDQLAGITFLFMLVPFLAYAIVIYLQKGYADGTNYRLTVLSTRAAFFLPGYALLMWLSLVAPTAYSALTVVVNIVEGYSFYTFFSMIIYNMGGSAKSVEAMVKSDKDYFMCSCCFPTGDKALFFRRTAWWMFHMLFTRVGFSVLAAICFYSDTKAGKVFMIIFQLICFAIVAFMVFHLVNFCKFNIPLELTLWCGVRFSYFL